MVQQMTDEIAYTGTVWKISSTRDGGWRVTIDIAGPRPPFLVMEDQVAVALLKSGAVAGNPPASLPPGEPSS